MNKKVKVITIKKNSRGKLRDILFGGFSGRKENIQIISDGDTYTYGNKDDTYEVDFEHTMIVPENYNPSLFLPADATIEYAVEHVLKQLDKPSIKQPSNNLYDDLNWILGDQGII